MILQTIISLAFMATIIFFAFRHQQSKEKKINTEKSLLPIVAVISVAVALRLFLGYTATGFDSDIMLFKTWGQLCNDVGYDKVYFSEIFLDYPPGYLYLLSWLDGLRGFLNIPLDSSLYTLLIKLPSIIADIACGIIIYKLAGKKFDNRESVFIAATYLFCPAVLVNSSVWGQIDSLCALILLLSLILLSKNRTVPSAIVYGIAVIFKPQMLIFAPIYLFYTIFKKNFWGLILGIGSAILTIMIISTPFIKDWNYIWLIEKYKSTMDYYQYYTINAYNIWGALGQNWASLPESSTAMALLNLVGPILATAFCGILLFKAKVKAAIFVAPAILMSTMFIFGVKMHERYLFPALLFILLTYILTHDKRFLLVFGGFSTVHFLNVAYVLFLNNSFISSWAIEIVLLSVCHLALYAYLLFLTYSVIICGKVPDTITANRSNNINKLFRLRPYEAEPIIDRGIKKFDIIAMGVIVVVYGVVAFWNLGATTTANTSWTPAEGEAVVFETSEQYSSLSYLCGIGVKKDNYYRIGSNVSVEVSDDNITWVMATRSPNAIDDKLESAEDEQTQLLSDNSPDNAVYEWHELAITNSKKYIRLTPLDSETVLNEIALKSLDGTRFIAVIPVSGDSKALLDEHRSVPLHPSYYNSTYFDEIYHARTAYEHIIGVEVYESTHPTLGKLIIAASIKIFGMNPFGWRFVGALCGILMLPVLYHIIKRLFGNSFLSIIGALLLAFDFMHFTQTRIATIDTYAVLFILLMYDAMLIFFQKDLSTASMKSLLLPLALCGIFMGIGIASKWTCAYGAIGLAVMFFIKLIKDNVRGEGHDKYFKKITKLCIWCLLFFIAIPFAIYFAAFLPLLLLPHNRANIFGKFIDYQVNMFNYHSQLVASHGFASPWYEWPLNTRNIWYVITQNFNGTDKISTIACLGNPLLWWTGFLALLTTIWLFVRERRDAAIFILIGFGAVYLPWIAISRLTFVYHYFTAVPFIIIAILYCINTLIQNGFMDTAIAKSGILAKVNIGMLVLSIFTIACITCFIVFYPVISGAPTTSEYANSLEWLPNWTFS